MIILTHVRILHQTIEEGRGTSTLTRKRKTRRIVLFVERRATTQHNPIHFCSNNKNKGKKFHATIKTQSSERDFDDDHAYPSTHPSIHPSDVVEMWFVRDAMVDDWNDV